MKTKLAGFTIAEALITLAVLGVTINLGLPSLTSFVEDSQLSGNTTDFFTSLSLARGEAVTRNSTISICKSDANSNSSCDNSRAWQSGWITFEDIDSDGVRDAGEVILDTYTGMNVSTVVSSMNFPNFISFRPSGSAHTSGTINICVNRNVAQDIFINATGRSRVTGSTCP